VWFDSHCHLHLCEDDAPVASIVERARAAGVSEMVTVGIDASSNVRAIELARSHGGVYASVGLHPNDSGDWEPDLASELEGFLAADVVVAVGETGLDFYRDRAPQDVQDKVFRAHIELAKQHDKALIIHTRESIDAALDVLEAEGPPERYVFHCWSGDPDQLERALGTGAFVSFAGNVTFKSADPLRTAARLVPTDRLLVETDAPFLAPVPHRGQRNEPAFVSLVGAAVATARDEEVEEVAEVTTRNAKTLFGLA